MVERTLFTVINDQLDWYKAKPERFERFLMDRQGLSLAEATKARLYFEGGTTDDGEEVEARPPTLIHGYARPGGPFPCWAMTLGSERVATDYLGKDASFLDSDGEHYFDPETGAVVDPKVRRMEYRFDILVITDHPDVTVWYYHLLKNIVMSQQDVLEGLDVEDLVFTGADMAPDPRFLPDTMYGRVFQVTVQGDESWEQAMARGTELSGIAVDSGDGTSGGTGAVDANVTVSTES